MDQVVVLILLTILGLVANGHKFRDDDVKEFESWFLAHGGKCRCNFSTDENGQTEVVADRHIQDGEATMMVPQDILLNTTVIESSTLGPSLEILSLTEALISKEQDVDKRAIMRLTQMAIYLLYSVQVQDEKWLTYFKFLLSADCTALWSWSKSDLVELQDEALMRRALKWHEETSLLTEKIAPKLKELGLFYQGIEPRSLVNGICAVQRSSFNVTSNSVEPIITLVPGLNMFPYHSNAIASWWTKGGALRYRYIQNVERGEKLHINMNPTGDGLQTLFDYGLFIPDGTKFTADLPAPNSELRRRLVDKLKVRQQIRYLSRFTFKAAALPYFRVQALSDSEVEDMVKDVKSSSKLSDLTQVIKSPTLHTHSKPQFSCKEEVVALNSLALHLRDALTGKVTGIPQDEQMLSGNISERRRTAVSFRLTFKKFVTKYLDTVSARAIEIKRECLSRKRDEL